MKRCAFLALLLALAAPTLAQVGGPHTLPGLKAEIQERADRRAYPVSGLDPAEVKEALPNPQDAGTRGMGPSLERDRRPIPDQCKNRARRRGGEGIPIRS